MYLCNDVIQNSKRKGPEYAQEYEKILPKAIKAVHKLVMCYVYSSFVGVYNMHR